MTSPIDERPVNLTALLEGAAIIIGCMNQHEYMVRRWMMAYNAFVDELNGRDETVASH